MYIYKNGVVETIIFMQPSAVKNRLKRDHMERIRFARDNLFNRRLIRADGIPPRIVLVGESR